MSGFNEEECGAYSSARWWVQDAGNGVWHLFRRSRRGEKITPYVFRGTLTQCFEKAREKEGAR